jgi:hypothetical protein
MTTEDQAAWRIAYEMTDGGTAWRSVSGQWTRTKQHAKGYPSRAEAVQAVFTNYTHKDGISIESFRP